MLVSFLQARSLFRYIDPSVKESDLLSPSQEDLSRVSFIIQSTIDTFPLNYIAQYIGTDPRKGYQKLLAIYGTVSLTDKIRLLTELGSTRLLRSGDLDKHLAIMTSLGQQIAAIDSNFTESQLATSILNSLPREDFGGLIQTLSLTTKGHDLSLDETISAIMEAQIFWLLCAEFLNDMHYLPILTPKAKETSIVNGANASATIRSKPVESLLLDSKELRSSHR